MTDASGAVVWDRVATPFGVEVSLTGSLTQVLRFPGQTNDPETSLNQNWHREYAPELGRYVQSDPIGLMGGVNTYAYVRGNPLTRLDPDGLNSQSLARTATFGSRLATAGGFAAADGPFPIGDAIALGIIAYGTYELCRTTDDDDENNPALQKCLSAAQGDADDWNDFCGSLPEPLGAAVAGRDSAKRQCRSKAYESPRNKINWCYNQFGN